MYLLTYNYHKCIEHASKLLAYKGVSQSTRYNANMYLAEAKCMVGQYTEAMANLEDAESSTEVTSMIYNSDTSGEMPVQMLVKQVESKFRIIKVSNETKKAELGSGQAPAGSESQDEYLTVRIINSLNKAVVDICSGDF